MLAEGIEVDGASLENGLLHVTLVRPEAASVSRTIDIQTGGSNAGAIETDAEPKPRPAGRGAAA